LLSPPVRNDERSDFRGTPYEKYRWAGGSHRAHWDGPFRARGTHGRIHRLQPVTSELHHSGLHRI